MQNLNRAAMPDGSGACPPECDEPMNESSSEKPRKPSLGRVFFSVLASMFGVQSNRRRQEDFAAGSPWAYILVGLVMTVLFILTVWLVVRMVLKAAGV